jgi:Domain of Unknown Function (DUF748)
MTGQAATGRAFLSKLAIGLVVFVLVLVALSGLAGVVLDKPLRGYLERQLNTRVEGYQFTIGELDFHPFGLAIELKNVTVRQREHPEPPVARFSRWHAGLERLALLRGRIVSNQVLDQPVFHFSLPQAKEEVKDIRDTIEERKRAGKRKWQEAVQAIYPFTINRFEIKNGEVSYRDRSLRHPLRLSGIQLSMANLSNVRPEGNQYPSEIKFDGTFEEQARITLEGRADVLAEPYPSIQADIAVDNLDLHALMPLATRYHVKLHQGRMALKGHVTHDPDGTVVRLEEFRLEKALVNYLYEPRQAEKHAAKKVAEETVKAAKNPNVLLKIDRAKIIESEFGVVHVAVDPPYRMFMADVYADISNVSNRLSEGIGKVALRGKFMGTGTTEVQGLFRPETEAPDFDLSVRVEGTDVRMLNDVLLAHGKVDASAGELSVYAEFRAKNGRIVGYVKPLIKDLTLFDVRQDRHKAAGQKLYEGVVEGIAKLFRNSSRDEMGTRVHIDGSIASPKVGTWDAVVQLIENAFYKAILPGFDRPLRGRS